MCFEQGIDMNEEGQERQFMCTSCSEPSEFRADILGDVVTNTKHRLYKCPECGTIDMVPRRNRPNDQKQMK